MAALQRLMSELNDLQGNPQPFVSVNTHQGDYYKWKGNLNGPDGTPFEGGLFEFIIIFSKNYPREPPEFYFQTPIFHPNIFPGNGRVCHSLLNHQWNPNCSPRTIIAYIIGLLNVPEPVHGFMCEATDACLRSKEEWFNIARDRTARDAMG